MRASFLSLRLYLLPGLCALACASNLPAQGSAAVAGPFPATPQRPTFTSDTSTTAPGTLELEFGAMGTHQFGGLWMLPTTLKFTPDVGHGILHRGEFSVSFNAADSAVAPAGRRTRFGDAVTVAFRRPVYQGSAFSLALAPQATFYLRGNSGARLGGAVLAAYTAGRNSLVGNLTWIAATSPAPANPRQQVDVATDFSRTLGETGVASRVSVFVGVLMQKPGNRNAAVSLGQGLAFRVKANLVLDLAVRQHGLGAGPAANELLAGFTYNFGRLRR